MRFFSGIKSTYKKSEAAVVVQNLLEHQAKAENFDLDSVSYANKLVTAVWGQKPDIFNGKFGQRPHKFTVAALALANGIDQLEETDPNWQALVLSLGNILSELEVNGRLYPLNSLDHQLLETAVAVFTKIANEEPMTYSEVADRKELMQTPRKNEPQTTPGIEERKEAAVKQTCLFIDASLLPLEVTNPTARQIVQNALESNDWPLPLEINSEALSQGTQRIGACLFFAGAADFLTQQYKLNDEDFLEIVLRVLRYFGLSEQNALLFIKSYPAMAQEPLGREALVDGANTIRDWLFGKDPKLTHDATFRLFDLVKQWENVHL